MENKQNNYTVLARKWRPQTFDQIIGQEPIKKALKKHKQEQSLKPFQAELIRMQTYLEQSKRPMMILFEGRDASGKALSENVYLFAVSREKATSSRTFFSQSNQRYFEIFSELQDLPGVRLQCRVPEPRTESCKCGSGSCRVELSNPTPHLAFLVHLHQADPGKAIRVRYDDNDFFLWPGEKKSVTILLHRQDPDAGPDRMKFVISGWNVERDEFFVDFC